MTERRLQISKDSYESSGMPRVRAELIEQGVYISRQRVARFMRLARMPGISRQRGFTVTTRRDKCDPPADDQVKRQFKAKGPNPLWVDDLTTIEIGANFNEWCVVVHLGVY